MSQIKCVVVEDNPNIRRRISSYVSENEHCKLLASSFEIDSVYDLIIENPEALILLDIELKTDNSIEYINYKKIINPILFITGFKKYAYEALQLNFRGYLIKPLTQFVFNRKIKEIYNENIQNEIINKNEPFFFINYQYKKKKILFNELLYIESEREYMHFITLKGKFSTLMTFKKVEHLIPSNNFVRIHNSYMVNMLHISEVFKNHVVVNKIDIPIGRSYKQLALRLILT